MSDLEWDTFRRSDEPGCAECIHPRSWHRVQPERYIGFDLEWHEHPFAGQFACSECSCSAHEGTTHDF